MAPIPFDMTSVLVLALAEPGKHEPLAVLGAVGFGAIIGWYVYYVNRYRKGEVQMTDIVTLIGTIGGAAVLRLFDAGTDLFGGYGIGLALGFFGYLFFLVCCVGLASRKNNPAFGVEWFLDGRRRNPAEGFGWGPGGEPQQRAMAEGRGGGGGGGGNPNPNL